MSRNCVGIVRGKVGHNQNPCMVLVQPLQYWVLIVTQVLSIDLKLPDLQPLWLQPGFLVEFSAGQSRFPAGTMGQVSQAFLLRLSLVEAGPRGVL